MREDPQPYKDPSQKAFAGDNFVRQSGDFHDMEALAVHSFSAHDKGQDIHMQGAPSQVCITPLTCQIFTIPITPSCRAFLRNQSGFLASEQVITADNPQQAGM